MKNRTILNMVRSFVSTRAKDIFAKKL